MPTYPCLVSKLNKEYNFTFNPPPAPPAFMVCYKVNFTCWTHYFHIYFSHVKMWKIQDSNRDRSKRVFSSPPICSSCRFFLEITYIKTCETSDPHSDTSGGPDLLRYDALSLCEWFPACQRNLVPSPSRVKSPQKNAEHMLASRGIQLWCDKFMAG